MNGFGAYTPYGSEDIEAYLRRFTSFLFTKGVTKPASLAAGASAQEQAAHAVHLTAYNDSRKSWLLASMGPDCYAILDNLCGAQTPEDCTLPDLENMLKTHFRPARNKRTERDKFHSRKQLPSESVAEFAVALGQLAKTCVFGDYLDEALQTQFINNVRLPRIKEKIEDGADNFHALVERAARYEFQQTQQTHSDLPAVNFINRKQGKKPAKHQKHAPPKQERPQKDKKPRGISGKLDFSKVRCFNCNNFGHFASQCSKPVRRKQDVKYVEADSVPDSPTHCIDLYRLEGPKGFPARLMVPVTINGVPIEMEVDTGAKASLIGKNIFNRYFSNQSLRSTGRLVWGTPLPMMGEFTATVCYKDQRAQLTVCVVNQDFPALFGLPWMKYIRLDWPSLLPEVLSVSAEPEPNREKMIAEFKGKYPHVFSYVPGPILNFEVSLQLSEGAQPVFRGPRVIAIPLREKTKSALDLMEKSEFIEACSPGPGGTPIVPVLKSNGEVRICGDFSVTLNLCLEVTGRALPLIDDLSTVSGNWFCILDMNQAYLQLKLSEASQEICKLNTPFGSYKCKRMPFGISSAPGIYQEVISSILAGIERTFIYLDDILLWGTTQEECLQTLHQILAKLEEYHVTLNVEKSQFLVRSVTYLGFLLDGQGSRPDPARMDELLKKPPPANHSQLKSFIGMITFFHKFGKDLATVLHPLYSLQKRKDWCWKASEQQAYDKALNLISQQVLVPYSLDRPLRLTADASPVGAGCVLAHVTENGKEEPIAFASKSFSDRELRYPVHEREAAALIFWAKEIQ